MRTRTASCERAPSTSTLPSSASPRCQTSSCTSRPGYVYNGSDKRPSLFRSFTRAGHARRGGFLQVTGEYGYLSQQVSLEQVADLLVEVIQRPHQSTFHGATLVARTPRPRDSTNSRVWATAAAEARSWVLSALMKVTAQLGECPPLVAEVVRLAKRSKHSDTLQVQLATRTSEHFSEGPSTGSLATLDAALPRASSHPSTCFLPPFHVLPPILPRASSHPSTCFLPPFHTLPPTLPRASSHPSICSHQHQRKPSCFDVSAWWGSHVTACVRV